MIILISLCTLVMLFGLKLVDNTLRSFISKSKKKIYRRTNVLIYIGRVTALLLAISTIVAMVQAAQLGAL